MFGDLLRKLDVNMRAFIILGFLLAAAKAASLGYQYGTGLHSANLIGAGSDLIGTSGARVISTGLGGGLSSGSGHSYSSRVIGTGGLSGGGLIGSDSFGSGLVGSGSLGRHVVHSGNYGGHIVSSGGIGSGLVGAGGLGVGNGFISSGSSSYRGGTSVIGLDALNNVPQTVELNKQYFYFSAPDEPVNEGAINRQITNHLKKNLQVVFIRAPENNAATSAALQLAKQAIEQRTAIYVLSKEQDGNQIVGQLQQIQESIPTAPEVKFIKYRTADDIAYAKETIQSQYDQLGGSTQVINGGIAPVLNYASHGGGVGVVGIGGVGGGSLLSGGISHGSSLLASGSGSYGGGSLVSSGSLGGGALLSGGLGHGSTVISSGSGSLGGGAILSGSGLGGIGGSNTVVSKVVETTSAPIVSDVASVDYLPPLKKKK